MKKRWCLELEDVRSLLHALYKKYEILQKNGCRLCEIDLSLAHSDILYEINKHQQPSMHQIAEILGVDITTFSRQIQTLIKAGLVKKSTNPEDKRMFFLSLTEEGEQAAAKIDSNLNKRLDDLLKQLSDFERNTVIHSLQILTKVMGSNR